MVALIVLQPEQVLKVEKGVVTGGVLNALRRSRRKPDHKLHFNFSEVAWKTGVQAPALLLARAGEYQNPQSPEQDLGIIAVARVVGHMRNPDGTRPIEVDDWTYVEPPIPLHEVTQQMEPPRARYLWSLFREVTRPLSDRLDDELRQVLIQRIPDYDRLVRSKATMPAAPPKGADDEALARAERRDRMATAVRMFGVQDWAAATPVVSQTPPPPHLERFEYELIEQDMLTDDSGVVPGWESVGRSVGGWFEFRDDNGKRLLVKNINFTQGETISGGDLIYIRDHPATVLAVQYKRVKRQRGGDLYFDSGERLAKQLHKLVELGADNNSAGPPQPGEVSNEPYRLSNIAGFVKFVEAHPLKPHHDELLSGYYVPADYYLALLRKQMPDRIPVGATKLEVERYIDSQTFIRLVTGGWIGSRSPASQELARKLRANIAAWNTGEVTLAFEETLDRQET